MKKFLWYLLALIAFLTLMVALYMVIAGKDIPDIDDSDLTLFRPDIPPDQNAFTYFLSATNVMYWPTNSSFVGEYLRGSSVEDSQLLDIISRNEEAIAIIRQGSAYEVCLAPEMIDSHSMCPSVGDWLEMGRILALKTRYERLNGAFGEATDTSLLHLAFAGRVLNHPESLIHYLVGAAVLKLGVIQALDLVKEEGVPPEEKRKLLAMLSDHGSITPGFIRAMKAEYKGSALIVEQIRNRQLGLLELAELSDGNRIKHKLLWRYPGFFLQTNKTKLMFAEFHRKLIYNASLCFGEMEQNSADAVFDFQSEGLKVAILPNSLGKLLYAIMAPALEKTLERKCETEGDIAAARTIAALHLYKLEHGAFPAELAALVPGYVNSVPLDPFSCQPFLYNPAEGIIYSVGKNMSDDGGSRRNLTSEEHLTSGNDRWTGEDAVFEIEAAKK